MRVPRGQSRNVDEEEEMQESGQGRPLESNVEIRV